MIVEKQDGEDRAKYGDLLIENISKKLTAEFGKGFSKRNLERMRKFYLCYPIATTLLSQLSWSHYLELIKIDDEEKRNFYMQEYVLAKWDVRELQRQRTTLLYERLILTKNKTKLLGEAKQVENKYNNKDFIKDPFVLEFLDIKENADYLECDLEKNLLKHLKEFLLELSCFVT